MSDSLEPCPKCWSSDCEVQMATLGWAAWWVQCKTCRNEGPSYFNRDTAVSHWNVASKRSNKSAQPTEPSGGPKT